MRPNRHENGPLAIVAPTLRRARTAAAALTRGGRGSDVAGWSLDRFLASESAATQIVLCPPGESVGADVRFLEKVKARLLWPPPSAPLSDAIAGLLGGDPELRPRRAPARATPPALLLEGRVTRDRARRALAGDARTWIVERATRVRLSPRELDSFSAAGVRWAALSPVRVVALAATPALARSRAWQRVLPRGTKVWRVPPVTGDR
jgi:hypothetical protein